jgi:hypothetical protein
MGGNTFNFFFQGLMWGLVKGGGYFGVLHEANQIIVVVGENSEKSVCSQILEWLYTVNIY